MKHLLISLLLLVCVGCASAPISPPLDITLSPQPDAHPTYTLDLDRLSLPSKPKPVYLNDKYLPVQRENAVYAAYSGPELAKMAAYIKLAKKEREIIEGQIELINTHIEQRNNWQTVANLKADQAQEFYNLYREALGQYQAEKHEHRMDNLLNRIMWYVIPIAGIALAIGG